MPVAGQFESLIVVIGKVNARLDVAIDGHFSRRRGTAFVSDTVLYGLTEDSPEAFRTQTSGAVVGVHVPSPFTEQLGGTGILAVGQVDHLAVEEGEKEPLSHGGLVQGVHSLYRVGIRRIDGEGLSSVMHHGAKIVVKSICAQDIRCLHLEVAFRTGLNVLRTNNDVGISVVTDLFVEETNGVSNLVYWCSQ